jgi:hypothetical protein
VRQAGDTTRTTRAGDGGESVHAIFAKALGNGVSAGRRPQVLADDARDEEAVKAHFAPLDALIDRLLARLDALAAEEAARTVAPSDETVLDLGEADVVEITEDIALMARVATVEAVDVVEPPSSATEAPPASKERKSKSREPIDHAAIATRLLYEDVIWLLGMNDGEGALISLERLLVTNPLQGEIGEFVELNKAKLLNLYEGYIGPFDKVPKL